MSDNIPIEGQNVQNNDENEIQVQGLDANKMVRGSHKDYAANSTLKLRSAMMEVLEENVRDPGVKAEITAFLSSPRGKEMVFYLRFYHSRLLSSFV